MSSPLPLVIGSRGSALALWQARHVAELLGGEGAGVRIEVIKTEGDRAFDLDLAGSIERGLFTRDIELALLDHRVDLAVHSLKDLPTAQPDGLAIASVLPRASVGDLLLVREDALSDDARLPVRADARVGTGSPRRQALLAHVRPDLVTGHFRGNVPTRVAKCVRGEVDALVLARAGVARLGLDVAPLRAFDLDPSRWLPAPAQGAIGLQARVGDDSTGVRLAAIDCAASHRATSIERDLLALLEAGCHAALGAWAREIDGAIVMSCGALSEDSGAGWTACDVTAARPDELVALAARTLASASAPALTPAWWTPAAAW